MSSRPLPARLLPVAIGLLGIGVSLRRPLLSGLSQVPGDWIDARFCHVVLEHGAAFLARRPGHASLFDPPFFHPVRGVLAYSDALLGFVPPYALLRAVGLAPGPAFTGWVALVLAANFALLLVLARRWTGAPPAVAAGAAFVGAFAAPALLQVSHPQLLPLGYVLGALLALDLFLRRARAGGPVRGALAALALCLAAQLWSGFYLAWFTGLVLALALGIGLLLPGTRGALAATLRRRGWALSLSLLAALALAAPLLLRYLAVARELGPRPWSEIEDGLPRLASWIAPGRESLVWGALADAGPFARLPLRGMHSLGLGLATTTLAVLGLVVGRRRPAVRVAALTALATVLVTTRFPGGWSSFRGLAAVVPGADVLRGVARVGLLLPIVATLGLASLAARVADRRPLAAGALLLLAAAEQLGRLQTHDGAEHERRVERIARAVQPGWSSFCVTDRLPAEGTASEEERTLAMWRLQVDAMWAAFATGVPTVNGYSGNTPPGWRGRFGSPLLDTGVERRRFRRTLEQWVGDEAVGWIDLGGRAARGDGDGE